MSYDKDFPTPQDLILVASTHVIREFKGAWPVDNEWIEVGDKWYLLAWQQDGKRKLTVYPRNGKDILAQQGISIL